MMKPGFKSLGVAAVMLTGPAGAQIFDPEPPVYAPPPIIVMPDFVDFPLPPQTFVPAFTGNGPMTIGQFSPFSHAVALCQGAPDTAGARVTLEARVPGATGFFAHHCAVFLAAEESHAAAEVGQQRTLFLEAQFAPFFGFLVDEALLILNQLDNGGLPELRNARLADIMRTRLFGEDEALPPVLTLTHASTRTPDRRPVETPMSAAIATASEAFRRVTFTAQVEGETDAVRFVASGTEARIVAPAGCNADACIVDLDSGRASVTYEFLDPVPVRTQLRVPVTLTVSAAARFEGDWQPPVTDEAFFDFAMCTRILVDELTASTIVAEARDRLFDVTLAVRALPGRRLAEGPVYASTPNPEWALPSHPGDIDDLSPSDETAAMVRAMDEVVIGRATDPYLAANSDATGGLHDAIAAIDAHRGQLRCDAEASAAALDPLKRELDIVQETLDRWQEIFLAASDGVTTWNRRVEHGLADFDATRNTDAEEINATIPDVLGEIWSEDFWFLLNNGVGALVTHFLTTAAGQTAADRLATPASVYSAVNETVRVVGAIADLESLFDVSAEMDEALGWLELQAYARIMRDRYADARDDLVLARDRLLEIERRNCICWQP